MVGVLSIGHSAAQPADRIAGLAADPATVRSGFTDNPAQQTSVPCTCRYRGEKIMLGDSICMKTSNGFVRARCAKYANNTSWEMTTESCDAVS